MLLKQIKNSLVSKGIEFPLVNQNVHQQNTYCLFASVVLQEQLMWE